MDTFSSMLILFFLVMNPLGNLPVFIAVLDRQPPVHRVAGVPDRAGDPAAVRILRRRNSEGAADYAGVAGAGGRDYSFHDRDQAGVRLRIGRRRKEVRAGK